jgi:DNA repair exonuclease SbcCD nuclease subunit
MRYLVCSDIHLNLNRRFDDMVAALDRVTEKVKELEPDQVLILGDVYTSRRPYARERAAFQRWLAQLPVGVVILRGNHDESPDGSHSFTEFTELEYDGVTVLENPATYDGIFLGHLLLQEACIGAANVQVADAEWTVARLLKEYPGCKAYLLGDVHKHQFVSRNPDVVYAGSIEHVDFAERNDPKGVLLVETGEKTTVEFVPLATRPMFQYDVDLAAANEFVVPWDDVQDAIVKVVIHGTKEQIAKNVNMSEQVLREHLFMVKELHVKYEVVREIVPRDSHVNETITPDKALELYLLKKDMPEAERAETMRLGLEVIKQCQNS